MSWFQRFDTTHSPVGLWNFDESLNDSSGNGFNLTVESGTARYSEIYPRFKAFFVSAARLVYNTSGTSLAITGDMTVQVLFQGSIPAVSTFFVSYAGGSGSGTQANNTLYRMGFPSGSVYNLEWMQENGSGSASTASLTTRTMPRLQLCHIAVTRASNVIQWYVNGRAYGSASSALTTPDGGTTSVFRVGGDAALNGPQGFLAGIKIINSALTGSQIKDEYNRTLGGTYGNAGP